MTLRVQELIEFLEDCDPNARVVIAYQPRYPLEALAGGVVKRIDVMECDDDNQDDVIITEGMQLGYGHSSAWGR